MFRLAFFLIFCFSLSPSTAQAQAVIKIDSENESQFFPLGETIGRFNVLCHVRPQNGRIRAGVERTNNKGVSIWRLLRQFRRQRVLAMESRGVPEQRITKFKKRFRPKPRNKGCIEAHENSPAINAPVAQSKNLTGQETNPLPVKFSATDPKGLSLTYEIVSGPTKGKVSGSGSSRTYKPHGHFTGTDTIKYRANNGAFKSNTATIKITIKAKSGDFAGDINSLEPYRQNLSKAEARHIVRKVAYSDPVLTEIAANQGLSALIDAMLESSEVPGVDDEAYALAKPLFSGDQTRWNGSGAMRYWDYIAIKGNPFRARMALFWHEHLPTHVNDIAFSGASLHLNIPAYMNTLIRDNVLGNFVDDLLKGYLLSLAGAAYYLDNKDNHGGLDGGLPNQNFARELLELFALGTHGVGDRKNIAMFNEDDVVAATAFVGGYFTSTVNGQVFLGFSHGLHDSQPYSIFQGQPWAATNVSFTPEDFIDYLVYNNENVARYIAEKLYAQFISPDSSEEVIQYLADKLIEHDFEIKPVMKTLLSSSAMFSEPSRRVCLESAYEMFVGLMRKLDAPLNEATIMTRFNEAVQDAGQRALAPDTVFGWEANCGVNRGGMTAYGEEYISSPYLIGQQRRVVRILDRLHSPIGYNWASLLPGLNATPEQTLTHFEDLFDLKLTSSEKALLLEYMTNSKKSNGDLDPIDWDPTNASLIKSKLSGLVELFFTHPRRRLK